MEVFWMIHYTIYAHGASIFIASSVIGLYLIYSDHLQISRINSKFAKVALRFLQLLLSPVIPVVIILQAVKLQVQQRTILAHWRQQKGNMGVKKPTEIFKMIEELETQKDKVKRIYTDFKLIEMKKNYLV